MGPASRLFFPLFLVLAGRLHVSSHLPRPFLLFVMLFSTSCLMVGAPCLLDLRLGGRSQEEELHNDLFASSEPRAVAGSRWRGRTRGWEPMCVGQRSEVHWPCQEVLDTPHPEAAPLSLCWKKPGGPHPKSPVLWPPFHLDQIPPAVQPRLVWS